MRPAAVARTRHAADLNFIDFGVFSVIFSIFGRLGAFGYVYERLGADFRRFSKIFVDFP